MKLKRNELRIEHLDLSDKGGKLEVAACTLCGSIHYRCYGFQKVMANY